MAVLAQLLRDRAGDLPCCSRLHFPALSYWGSDRGIFSKGGAIL
ncbi:hypothetical protein [Neosynechococcus sphagnicola]|nr:hypothetical protein [Neosynechococcus sphagnicola]